MAQGTRMIAQATRAQIQTGQPDSDGHRRVETSVGGVAVFYAETTVPCIGSASPSKKALVLDAFWRTEEVIEKARALDYTKVK